MLCLACIMNNGEIGTPDGYLPSSLRFTVQGVCTVCMSGFPKGTFEHRHIEQLRPRYGLEEDLDPGQISESMVPQENQGLGETPKELGDSQMEELGP